MVFNGSPAASVEPPRKEAGLSTGFPHLPVSERKGHFITAAPQFTVVRDLVHHCEAVVKRYALPMSEDR